MNQHESYIRLIEEYSHTEIFKEIISFLNINYPKWSSNHFLGSYAVEFVETTIQNLDSLQDKEDHTKLEMIKNIREEIASRFNDTYFNYQLMFSEQLIINFESTFEEELYDNRHLPYQEYSDFYDNLFDAFEKNEKDKIIYNFKDELVY
ncbi:MAG: hypothetical protein PHW92_01865 [Lutibacter sp.]|nr:hypothetical protein [Lutibacter sp.]